MQIVLERDSIDKPSEFLHLSATTNFSCKGVFNQNIWSQIPPRVCTLVLFIPIGFTNQDFFLNIQTFYEQGILTYLIHIELGKEEIPFGVIGICKFMA